MSKHSIIKDSDMAGLYQSVHLLIQEARKKVAVYVNAEATLLNYKVGSYIHHFILEGNRATYGSQIITKLSEQLTQTFGTGWSDKHLRHCLRTAETFTEEQIISAVQRQLSWTHLKTLAYENDPLKRNFYLEMTILQRWNTRTLAEQIDKMLYERTAIASKPQEQIAQALKALNAAE